MGLAIVDSIVRQNGGFIWVDSELGVGTSLKIYLFISGHAEDVLRRKGMTT